MIQPMLTFFYFFFGFGGTSQTRTHTVTGAGVSGMHAEQLDLYIYFD